MQEAKITDIDGATREYAYDSYDGRLYLRTHESRHLDPGRPYYPIARIDDLRSAKARDENGVVNVARYGAIAGIHQAHAALWSDPDEAAEWVSINPRERTHWRAAT